jgi:DNA-binding NarL/FixJ family response regulator
MKARRTAESIRVLLVDDHTMLRQGVRALLTREPDIEVIGEAGDGVEALDQVENLHPDVVVMDVVMPRMNGLEATRQLRERHPDLRILILSMYDDDEYVTQIIQAGAAGYVLKHAAGDDLVSAIHDVHKGGSFLYPPIAAKLIDDYVRRYNKPEEEAAPEGEPLTARERQVLTLIADGNTNGQIAAMLGVSRKTVDTHRANAMRKLELHDVTELVKYALRTGLIKLE